MNEYGFYFDQPYVGNVEGMTAALIFYEDGRMSIWAESMYFGGIIPEEEGWKPMIGALPFSEDGMSFEMDGIVLNLEYHQLSSFPYERTFKTLANGNEATLIIHHDGSVTMETEQESKTLPAGSCSFDGNIFAIQVDGETIYGAVYPDGSKIVFAELLYSADLPRGENPSITLNNGTLTISPVNGATQYKIFIDDVLYTTTSSLSVNMSNALNNKDNVFVSVQAVVQGLPTSLCSSIWISSQNKPEPGLYDNNNQLLASWASLILDYGLRLDNDYQNFPSESGHVQNVAYSLENIIKKPELASGTKLIIGFCDWIGDFALSTVNDQLTYVMLSSTITYVTDSPCIYKNTCYLDVDPDNPIFYIQNGCVIDRTTKTLIWGNKDCIVPSDGSVLIIGPYAFSNALTGTHLVVANGIEKLSYYAYGNNDTITTVTLPVTLKQIDGSIFAGCDSLTTINYEGTVEQWKQVVKNYKWYYKDYSNGHNIPYVQCSDGQVPLR